MQADYSIELGPGDPVLEMPWTAGQERPGEAAPRYFDLKRHPDLLLYLPEAQRHPEMGKFLVRINAPGFPLETAKCDVWPSAELFPEEEIFGASCKFVCYVDLLFTAAGLRLSFEKHEALAKGLHGLLRRAPEMAAAAEFVVRRCYYHGGPGQEPAAGFYMTAYVTGYGDAQEEARRRWTIALQLLQHALIQSMTGVESGTL